MAGPVRNKEIPEIPLLRPAEARARLPSRARGAKKKERKEISKH
jgi:hypothetical protein